MSLCRRGTVWHYDFLYRGNRYRGATQQTNRHRARKGEALLMLQAREKQRLIRTSRVPSLSEFAPRFLNWVEASTLELATKRYYQYGWRMLKVTDVARMRLDHINTDAAEVLRFPG